MHNARRIYYPSGTKGIEHSLSASPRGEEGIPLRNLSGVFLDLCSGSDCSSP